MARQVRNRTSGYNRLVSVAVAFGSLTYGYSASIIGSTIGQPGWYAFFDLPLAGEPGYGTTTTNAIATANGLFSAGGAIGSLFIMWAATALGRKRCIQIGALLSILGGALQGGAANLGYATNIVQWCIYVCQLLTVAAACSRPDASYAVWASVSW